MTTIATVPATAATAPAALAPAWRKALAAALLAAGAALAWYGGLAGLAGAAVAAAAVWLALRGDAASAVPAARSGAADIGGRFGADVMVSQVVPVWSRQIGNTRDSASEGLANILQAFAEMSGALETLNQNLSASSVTAEPGAVDGAVRQGSPALDRLAAASARAFAERDAAVAELARCADGLTELEQLAKQGRELARHTRLVAFNASIEANRHRTQAEGGTHAVASELRMLSIRMAETSDKTHRVVQGLAGAVRQAHRAGQIGDTTPDELRLEIDLRAREALAALLGAFGASVQGSAELQQANATLRAQLESAFVHFQFGDRVSQMLSIIVNDMGNFARWVAAHPNATQSDAAEWLAALEGSYTMDEQRSSHHGNVHVERSSGVDFF